MTNLLTLLSIAVMLFFSASSITAQETVLQSEQEQINKQIVLNYMTHVINGRNFDAIGDYVTEDLIQHNANLPNGIEPLREFWTGFFESTPDGDFRIVRVIAEDDFVVTHSQFTPNPELLGLVVVDIYRVEDGLIAEHWDVVSEIPEETVSGNSVIDGTDLLFVSPNISEEEEQANEQIVLDYMTTVINGREFDVIGDYIAEDLIQHNANLPNGVEPLSEFWSGFFESTPDGNFRIVRTITEGNLVITHSQFTPTPDALGLVVVDIYRIEDGLIAEHWDVVSEIPEETVSGNSVID